MGSSNLPSEMISAFLMAQFEELDTINNLRKEVFNKYYDGTRELEEMGKVIRPIIPDYNDINYHMFYLILNSEKERNNLLEYFKQNDIIGTLHYLPLHTSPMGLEMGYKEGDLPITESISSRLIRLPMYAGLTNEEVDKVLFHLKEFFKK